MLPLIHCGCGVGQGAIASDTCQAAGRVPLIQEIAAKRRFSQECRINWTLNAQSSGLADRSGGRPKLEIPNGLGSEFSFGAPQVHLSDEGAISSLRIVDPKLPRLSVRYWS